MDFNPMDSNSHEPDSQPIRFFTGRRSGSECHISQWDRDDLDEITIPMVRRQMDEMNAQFRQEADKERADQRRRLRRLRRLRVAILWTIGLALCVAAVYEIAAGTDRSAFFARAYMAGCIASMLASMIAVED